MKNLACWIARGLGLTALVLVTLAGTAWASLTLLYAGPFGDAFRLLLAAIVALVGFAALFALLSAHWRRRFLAVHLALFLATLGWWSSLSPSNEREWQTDVAVLPRAEIDGDIVTVRNIRNFDYRSETDYTPAYYDKRFDLRKLQGVDLIAVYWMGPAIAHILLSFDFSDGEHLAISIETRKEKDESYSTLRGFFRQYELYYVVADERDVIRLRTNYRKDPPEDVYVYRVRGPIENGRRLFLSYMEKINALHERAEFYNTLTTNCTTNIWFHSETNPGHLPFSWKILASGYVPEYLYESGRLDTTLPLEQLRRHALVNSRAHAADKAADFSQRIRAPLPLADRSAGDVPQTPN
jgi:hypothetical protein